MCFRFFSFKVLNIKYQISKYQNIKILNIKKNILCFRFWSITQRSASWILLLWLCQATNPTYHSFRFKIIFRQNFVKLNAVRGSPHIMSPNFKGLQSHPSPSSQPSSGFGCPPLPMYSRRKKTFLIWHYKGLLVV